MLSCSPAPAPVETCSEDATPAGFDPQSPKVTYDEDVKPIFAQSCAFSSCHGDATRPNGIYLGADKAEVLSSTVGVPARTLSSMRYVAPGDPQNSFLMRKMDATQCALETSCTNGNCGGSMPKNSPILPAETRDVIRRWIAQGARAD